MFRLEVIGNLGSDAQVRNANGSEFLSFSVGHSEKSGEVQTTVWVDCTLNKVNARLLPFLVRGAAVYVCGRAFLRTYKGRDGAVHAGISCRVDALQLCGSSQQSNQVPKSESHAEEVPF